MVINMSSDQLNEEMKKLATSDDPVDIATLAYIWGISTRDKEKNF